MKVYMASCNPKDTELVGVEMGLGLLISYFDIMDKRPRGRTYKRAKQMMKEQDTKIRIFLDSGAPTLYNSLARSRKGAVHMGSFMKDRKHDDFSWLTDKRYLEYRDNYIAFIKANRKMLDIYINLDIVNNAEATWDNQKYLEKHGVEPVPVWHFGCDVKWLKRYLDAGYKYIAVGGMVPNPARTLVPGLDDIWSEFLTDKDGLPVCKVHGFAATSVELMTRYPWFSVDSASWIKHSMYGAVVFPQRVRGIFRYDLPPQRIFVSNRSVALKEAGMHLANLSPVAQDRIVAIFKERGFDLGKSEWKYVPIGYKVKGDAEILHTDDVPISGFGMNVSRWRKPLPPGKYLLEMVVESGLSNDHAVRDRFNAEFYMGMEKASPPWPWPFGKKAKGLLV